MRRKVKYPQYKIISWIDTGPEAFAEPEAKIFYGIDCRRSKNHKWAHCCEGTEPLFFRDQQKAIDFVVNLEKKRDGEAA